MDTQKVAYFVDNYSRMTDEELSFLVVTRSENLSDEARHALETVIKGRDQITFKRELRATASEVTAQAHQAELEIKKQKIRARHTRTTMRVICALTVIAGVLIALFWHNENGWLFCAAGIISFAYFELRRLLWRFVLALFRAN